MNDFTEITTEEMDNLTRIGIDEAIAKNDGVALYLKEMRINPLMTHNELVGAFQFREVGSILDRALQMAADSIEDFKINDIYDPDFIEEMSTVILIKMQEVIATLPKAQDHAAQIKENHQRKITPTFTDDWSEIGVEEDEAILDEREKRFKHVQAKNYGIDIVNVLTPLAEMSEGEALYPSEFAIGDKLLTELTSKKDKGYEFSRMILSTLSARDFCDEQIINSNWRLPISMSKKQYHPDLFLHFIQEGNSGLVTARNKFDYRSGNQFSTYATWWVRQAITREQYGSDSDLYIPVHATEDIHIIFGMRQKNPGITNDEIVAMYNERYGKSKSKRTLSLEKLELLDTTYKLKNASSMDRPLMHDEDTTLADFIPDTEDVENTARFNVLREKVRELIDVVPFKGDADRRRLILRLRFGIGEFETDGPRTLEEVAQYLTALNNKSITRERVRQIEDSTLNKFRLYKGFRDLNDESL